MRKRTKEFTATVAAIAVALSVAMLASRPLTAAAQQANEPAIDGDDIGGVVSGPNGPEAGVWVIAESVDLPTKFAKIVVTDEQGRYVIPDLPAVNYSVWVRGYGLVDSPKMRAKPGQHRRSHSGAGTERCRGGALLSGDLLVLAVESSRGKRVERRLALNDPGLQSKQANFLRQMKNIGCIGCHQLGQEATRTIPAQFGVFKTGEEAWIRRLQSGLAGEEMTGEAGFFSAAPLKYFGEWTDRLAKGELPKTTPPRPQGVERNVVITTWEWGDEKTLHARSDFVGSAQSDCQCLWSAVRLARICQRRHANPGSENEQCVVLQAACAGSEHAGSARLRLQRCKPMQPSAYWGDEKIWNTKANNHNAMFDKKGRVWLAASVRGMDNPAFCKKGSNHPSAKVFPLDQSPRQVAMLDPKTMKYTFVDTCFATHHLQFGYDDNDTLWFSGTGRWSAGSTPKCSTRPAMPPSRRAGRPMSWTPTATASATTMSSPVNRPIRARTRGSSLTVSQGPMR